MANRRFYQFTNSLNAELTLLEAHCNIGSTGAVSGVLGAGISDIVRLAQGQYKILLQDNYFRFLGLQSHLKAPNGAPIVVTSGASGTVYTIVTLGNTNFQAMGLDASKTAAVGMSFKASGAGTGTGTIAPAGVSGITNCEVVGNPNTTITDQKAPYIIIQTMGATDASTTTQIAQDPASGSSLNLVITLRNSTVKNDTRE